MQRAYSTFEVKSVNAESRILEGIASTPTPDAGGDVMEPGGAQFSLPMPLLWFHDQRSPIGEVFEADVRPEGIYVKARISKVDTPGAVKSRVDEAWDSISATPPLARGLSIGWKPIESRKIPNTKFTRFLKWVWGELSVVTLPMNQEATILSVKEAASGHSTPSGDSDPLPVVRAVKGASPMTTAEQITSFEAKHGANLARMNALVLDAKGSTLDDSAKEEYANLERENESITEHLPRLKRLEELNIKAATAITPTTSQATASAQRSATPVVQVKSMQPKGSAFTKFVMCIAAANGDSHRAIARAKGSFADTPEVELMVKAAIAAGDTTTSGWATELAVQQPINDFIELLRPKTLLGRIPNLRRVPFNVSVPAQTAGGTYGWVGQGKVKPLTKLTTATVTLGINKIAGIIVLTQELVKISQPSAVELVQEDLVGGITKFMDEQFIDPSIAASGTVSPASITNGTSAVTSAGTSNDNLRTDLKAVMSAFLTANLALDNSVWIMSEANAFAAMMAVNALGAPLFPGMQNSGSPMLFGRPVIATQSASTTVALVDAQGILVADDGGVSIDVSKEASLQMDSAPTDPPDAAAVYVSMFQQNMIALRAERFVTWKRARTASVKYVAQTYV